jgi:tetratricopeptide (TPR) repeat protein
MVNRRWLGALALTLAVPWALPAGAQLHRLRPTEALQVAQAAPAPAPPTAEYDAAFRAVLADPANLDLTFRFAALAIAVGDLEGAVSAFERLLIFNPNLPRIRYELGRLYLELGSDQIARGYFEDAARAPDLPADVRGEIASSLAEIDKRQSSTSFAVALQAGMRWQSNANAANSAGIVKLFGLDADLDPTSRKRPDWNGFAQATLSFAYDLGTQDRDALEVGVQLYGTRQLEVSSLDLQVAQVDIGPRLRFGGANGSGNGWTLRPFLIGNVVTLDDSRYFVSYGGGAAFDVPITSRFATELELRSRLRRFHVSEARSTISDKDGWEYGLRAGTRYALSGLDQVRFGIGTTYTDAKAGYEQNAEYGLDLTYLRQFADPFGLSERPWIASLSGGRTLRYYNSPDSTVDPDTHRYDREWTVGFGMVARITGSWSVNLQVLQQWARSSVANFTFTNTSASIALGYAF